MNSIQTTLRHFGLSNAAINVYSTLLTQGETDVSTLIKHTKLSRKGVHDAIDVLFQHDLLEYRKQGRAALYKPAHPETLHAMAEKKRQELSQNENHLQGIIHEFTATYNLILSKPGITFFEGKDGIIQTYNELLEDGSNIDSIEDKGDMASYIPDYARTYPKERVKRNIFNRVIAPSTNPINATSNDEMRETRYIDVRQFPFEMDIKINDRRVVLTTFKAESVVGIGIVHPEIVKNFKILFDYWWMMAK